MTPRTRFSKAFYDKRSLAKPHAEWWPEDAGELAKLIREKAEVPRLLLGDGQHVRSAVIGERTFDAIRTEKCGRILSVDRESRIVRVEAGARWGDLQQSLSERGLTLERYALQPASATIGGLLGRHEGTGRELWDGDLRGGCLAMSAVTPAADYRYLAAPRKASGPDLRHLFIGSEGLFGAILDVTLVAWAPSEARLLQFNPQSLVEASSIVTELCDAGVRISWVHYGSNATGGSLAIALHGPPRMLDAAVAEAERRGLGECEQAGTDAVRERRASLEKRHGVRRALASSKRSMVVTVGLADLAALEAGLPAHAVEQVEAWSWTRHRVRLLVRFSKAATGPELPARWLGRAHSAHPLIDDEAVHWPHTIQSLKLRLDPDRALAVGP